MNVSNVVVEQSKWSANAISSAMRKNPTKSNGDSERVNCEVCDSRFYR